MSKHPLDVVWWRMCVKQACRKVKLGKRVATSDLGEKTFISPNDLFVEIGFPGLNIMENSALTKESRKSLTVRAPFDESADCNVSQAVDDCAHRSEEHTSELQSLAYLVCRLLLEKKKK